MDIPTQAEISTNSPEFLERHFPKWFRDCSIYRPKVGDLSPWGKIQEVTRTAAGIYFASTASHGGVWISPERRRFMRPAPKGQSVGAWWEEDCMAVVPLMFFDCVDACNLFVAFDCIERWNPAWLATLLDRQVVEIQRTWAEGKSSPAPSRMHLPSEGDKPMA